MANSFTDNMVHPRYWIKAFRLRTLPLAFSTVWMGSAAAYVSQSFKFNVALLATTTTLFLQILSNLANDYGDAVSGADKIRTGPARMVQGGFISRAQMLAMIGVFVFLSLLSGIALLWIAMPSIFSAKGFAFFILGILAIAAAINYTVGRNPYGYKGWGDFFVFVFFGLLGVFGTFYLHMGAFDPLVVLPASAIGFLSVGVLNVNNLRDRENDARSGKNSLVVIFGKRFGVVYQFCLVIGALGFMAAFIRLATGGKWIWLVLLMLPAFAIHLHRINQAASPQDIDPELKRLSVTTFLTVLLFVAGLFLNAF
ncbi:MAG: 1,4-dihydroxy-2-naphthoate octaprenyltransferase [Breznakibacter sp.]